MFFKLASAVFIFCQLAAAAAAGASLDDAVLKGTVVDAETGEPLIGAALMVSNTTEGVVTDLDGAFNINLLRDRTAFEVSYIGYRTVPFEISVESGTISLLAAMYFP